jgi:hypothetical protein
MGPSLPRRQPRIAIIGAGPAGLSTAWFLKKQGYRDVTVFEKLGRVGGLAESLTSAYRSFDLGANYITPAYRETMKIARSVGAETFTAKTYLEARANDSGGIDYRSMSGFVFEDEDGNRIPLLRFVRAVLRYARLRWRVRKWIDRPDFRHVSENPDLCVPFAQWLDTNQLGALKHMFQIPTTMMGYGFLDQIAAPYALKFLSLSNFATLVLRGLPGVGTLFPYPRRFREGFQRMWERVSWGLDVRLNVAVKRVTRTPGDPHPICIELEFPEQIFQDIATAKEKLYFDHLVLACPLTPDVLSDFLDMSEQETTLFDQVETYSFCHATVRVVKEKTREPYTLKAPVLCCTPFTRATIGMPWAAVQMFPKDTNLVQFYTRVVPDDPQDPDAAELARDPEFADRLSAVQSKSPGMTPVQHTRAAFREYVFKRIEKLLKRMGAEPAGLHEEEDVRWRTYNRWPYFGHVSAEAISKGFFEDLERLQGQDHTWYVGGVTNFELIESIVCYAKSLASRIDEHVTAGG